MKVAQRVGGVLVLAFAAMTSAVSANAQDYGAAPMAGMSWHGFYVGGNFGGALDGSSLSIFDLSGAQLSITNNTDDQFVGGVHAGYNLQGAHILYGIEGDADFGDNISFLGSLRARLVWAGERVLVYGTTGIGFINADAKFTINSPFLPPSSQSSDISEVGFVIGGGLDFKVMPRLSLGAEGLFYNFANDEQRLTTSSGAAFPTTT